MGWRFLSLEFGEHKGTEAGQLPLGVLAGTLTIFLHLNAGTNSRDGSTFPICGLPKGLSVKTNMASPRTQQTKREIAGRKEYQMVKELYSSVNETIISTPNEMQIHKDILELKIKTTF